MQFKTFLVGAAVLAALALSSCTKEESKKDNRVAVFLPSIESNVRWKTDKEYFEEALAKAGLDCLMNLAVDGTGSAEQILQIQAAIESGIKTLVITAIDFNEINSSKVLEGSNLNVICHDRMLFGSNVVNFLSACDNNEVGEFQAAFLIRTMEVSGKKSMTLEMLGGPATDNNSKSFFEGAWEILKPYVDNGVITIPSGKTSYESVAMASWESASAESELKERFDKFYPDGTVPDLILSPNDIAAIGAVNAVDKHIAPGLPYPTITGQDNTDEVRALIKEGKVSMTVDKSIKDMVYNTVNVASMYVEGITPIAPATFDNGVKPVPFVKSSPKVITKGNL